MSYLTIKEAPNRNYEVKTVDIVELPEKLRFNEGKKVEFLIIDFFNIKDNEIVEILSGCDAFV